MHASCVRLFSWQIYNIKAKVDDTIAQNVHKYNKLVSLLHFVFSSFFFFFLNEFLYYFYSVANISIGAYCSVFFLLHLAPSFILVGLFGVYSSVSLILDTNRDIVQFRRQIQQSKKCFYQTFDSICIAYSFARVISK